MVRVTELPLSEAPYRMAGNVTVILARAYKLTELYVAAHTISFQPHNLSDFVTAYHLSHRRPEYLLNSKSRHRY
jgi:hypothetical protein